MKFFLEFGSCCGAIMTPPADSAVTLPQQEVAPPLPSRSRGRSTKLNSSAHWKPALSAISEDLMVSDLGSRKIKSTVRSQNKASSEKAKSTTIATSPGHYDAYRRGTVLTALPGLSPTPFLF